MVLKRPLRFPELLLQAGWTPGPPGLHRVEALSECPMEVSSLKRVRFGKSSQGAQTDTQLPGTLRKSTADGREDSELGC